MKIGIIGAGTMGSGIAQVAAMSGNAVKIYDANDVVLQGALQSIRQNLRRSAEKGKISLITAGEIANRIKLSN